jgi:hypothetical protein
VKATVTNKPGVLGLVRQGLVTDAGSKPQDGADGADVVTVLRHAHGEAIALLDELAATPRLQDGASPQDLGRRVSIIDALVGLLSAHEAAEEAIFWPAVADAVDGGPSIAQLARSQEREGKAALEALRRAERKDPERFEAATARVATLLLEHVAFEESVFEKVTAQVAEPSRRSLGSRVALATRRGPTRPHPFAPSDAGALHLAGPLAAGLDRLRDRARRRPAEDLDPKVVERAIAAGTRMPMPRPATAEKTEKTETAEKTEKTETAEKTEKTETVEMAPAALPVGGPPGRTPGGDATSLVFVALGAQAAAGLGLVLCSRDAVRQARALAVVAGAAEVAVAKLTDQRTGGVAEDRGERRGMYGSLAQASTIAGTLCALLLGRRRGVALLSGFALLTGAALEWVVIGERRPWR